MPTLTLLLIVWAVHPENRMHSTVINEANLVRLQWKIFILVDPVSDPTVKKLFLFWITFTNFNIALTLHDIEHAY